MVRASLAIALLLTAQTAVAVTLVVVPSATTIDPGGSVDIDVIVSNLGDMASPSLGSFDLILTFDPAVFAFGGVVLGTDLGVTVDGSLPGIADLNVFAVSLQTPTELVMQEPSSFVLFTATFHAVGTGNALFELALNSPPGDEVGDPLTVDETVSAVVVVSPVLAIPTLSQWGFLLLVAVLALAGVRRLGRAGR